MHRRLETLELRFDRMCSSAETIAGRLKDHPSVQALRFPGLEDDPSHNLARAQMERFGFLIGADAGIGNGGGELHRRLHADPAGDLVRRRAHLGRTPRPRGDAVAPGFVRLSVGCEPVEELWKAMERALGELPWFSSDLIQSAQLRQKLPDITLKEEVPAGL